MDTTLYDNDFYQWTQQQATAIRAALTARTNLPIDWENVAEEIEDLGKSRRRELASRLGTIVEHLLKLDLSPAEAPRAGWIETIVRSRSDIERLLEENPSLRSQVAELLADEAPRSVRLLAQLLSLRGEATPQVLARLQRTAFTDEQVLGDWFPGAAGIGQEAAANE